MAVWYHYADRYPGAVLEMMFMGHDPTVVHWIGIEGLNASAPRGRPAPPGQEPSYTKLKRPPQSVRLQKRI